MRRNRLLIGVTSLLFLLSGCIKLDVDMKVKSNDKVDGTAVVAFSEQILTLTGQSKKDFLKEMKTDTADIPKGAKVETYDKDGYVGQKMTFKDLPASEFGKAMDSASTGPANDAGDMKLVKEGGKWKFSGTMDLVGEGTTKTDPKNKEADALMKGFVVKIKVTFPGKVVKADKSAKIKGKTVSWEPKFGQKVEMLAIAETH